MSDIQELEQAIKDAEDLSFRRQMALKLSENHEFRKLFMEEYFVNEAARLVHMSADPTLTQLQRDDALAMAQGAGHAKRYLSYTIQMGYRAEVELPQMREALEELRAAENS